MESLQKFFYDLFLGVNWDKGYCEPTPQKTNQVANKVVTKSNEEISAAVLPLVSTTFKRRKLNPSN